MSDRFTSSPFFIISIQPVPAHLRAVEGSGFVLTPGEDEEGDEDQEKAGHPSPLHLAQALVSIP